MTEQLPSADQPDDDELHDPWHDQIVATSETFGAPEVQSLLAFILSVLSMLGIGLLNGAAYVFTSVSSEVDYKSRNIVAALLGAAFALLPIILGWRVSARVLDSDPRWVATFARVAVILGLVALVLRLVLAVIAASASDPRAALNF